MDTDIRILIVEPEKSLATKMEHFLKTEISLGFQARIKIADDGEMAYNLAQEWQPHVVISEIMLANKNGWDIVSQLKKIFLPETLFIAVTGIGPQLNELASPLYGFNLFFDKPLGKKDYAKIIAAIKNLFRVS